MHKMGSARTDSKPFFVPGGRTSGGLEAKERGEANLWHREQAGYRRATSDEACNRALRAGGLTCRRAERQIYPQQQAVRSAVLGLDRAAERLDIASGDPQPDAEM